MYTFICIQIFANAYTHCSSPSLGSGSLAHTLFWDLFVEIPPCSWWGFPSCLQPALWVPIAMCRLPVMDTWEMSRILQLLIAL